MSKKITGPRCPRCGNPPYDIAMLDKSTKPPTKRLRWFCPSVTCNPMAETMADDQVWG